MACLALTLSPMRRIVSARGPMNANPERSTCSAKSAFSERNPYPGWIASASVTSAAEMIAGMLRYECEEAAGPMHTLSSASRTYFASASATECTATVFTPISRQARWMRSAISPRVAMRTVPNMWPVPDYSRMTSG